MSLVEAICTICFLFIGLMMTQNVIAGLEAQSLGVATHQEERP